MLYRKISATIFDNHSKKTEDKIIKNKTFYSGFLAIAILLAVGLACSDYGTKLDFNGGEVYYTKNSNESDARKLGEYLEKNGVFTGGAKKTVQLDKEGSTNQVRMVIIKEKQDDPQYLELLKTFAGNLSSDVFNDAPTEIHVCDDHLKTIKVVKQ